MVLAAFAMAAPPSPDALVPEGFAGNVAAVQTPSGEARLFYQRQGADNTIQVADISGPFTTGHFLLSGAVVPSSQALAATPLAATIVGNFQEVRTL